MKTSDNYIKLQSVCDHINFSLQAEIKVLFESIFRL